MIQIRGLRKKFGTKEVLKGVNLDIVEGKTTVIFGLSGGGKSTIIKHISGLLKADEGEIIIDGIPVSSLDAHGWVEVRKKIGFLFQSGALFDSMNVFDNVAFPLREHTKMTPDEIEAHVEEALRMVALVPSEVRNRFPDELSGGMRKRVGLARTIIMKPKYILYDEPTSGLDPVTSDQITQLIRKLQREIEATSLLISHDIKESFKAADYVAMLFDGEIIEYLPKEAFMKSSHPVVRQFLEGSSQGPIRLRDE
ncbi:MAG: ABC transporter ATP-binding protein [Campylobacterales bacterium]